MFVLQYWHFQMTCLPLIFLGILHVNVFNVGLPKDLKKFWELESRTTWYQQHPILSETCWQFLFCEGANPTFNCGASHHASVIENTSAWNPPRIHEQICRAAYRCVSTEMALNHSVTWKSHMKLLDIQFLTSICQFWEPFHLCVLVLAYPVLWGKQKFEILTIQFPLCSSSSTLQTRILRFCSTYRPGHFHSYSNDRMNQMLRCACINTVFSKTIAREKVLEVLAWSFQALSSSAKNIWFSFEAKECTTHDQRSCYVLCIHWTYLVWGKGEYPSLDPWGNSFSEKHDPHRFRLAGTKISYFGILEGIQCDQDYLDSFQFASWPISTVLLSLLWCDSMGEQPSSYWPPKQSRIIIHCLWASWRRRNDTKFEFQHICSIWFNLSCHTLQRHMNKKNMLRNAKKNFGKHLYKT